MMRLIPVRVLVLDDDDSVCRKLGEWLTAAAYDVAVFTDSAAALEYAQKVTAPVALVDLRLPGADAAEVIGGLLTSSQTTRVIALAAFPQVAALVAAVRAGARDILVKPLQAPVVLAAIERQLAELGISVHSEDDYNGRLGKRIRAARAAANLKLSDVAEACGLSIAQLSNIELGKSATTLWTLARICAALNTRVGTLLEGS